MYSENDFKMSFEQKLNYIAVGILEALSIYPHIGLTDEIESVLENSIKELSRMNNLEIKEYGGVL